MQLSTADAARRLGVSDRQVRRLVARGVLPATRIGGRLVLDSVDVGRRAARAPGRGRPFAPRASWGVLWELSGERASWLHSSERSRLRAWLRRATPEAVALATRTRAHVAQYRVLPRYVADLAALPNVIRGGVSAADEVGADIVSVGSVDLYVSEEVRRRLVTDFGLTDSPEPNVALRIPTLDRVLTSGRTTMPSGVVAMDLVESDDTRTRRAGQHITQQLLRLMT